MSDAIILKIYFYPNIKIFIFCKIYRQSLQFLRQVPFFCNWSINEISVINLLAKVKDYTVQNTIFDEGDSDDMVYIIKEGEVELSKTLHLKISNRKLNNKQTDDSEEPAEEEGVGKMLSRNLKRRVTLVRLGPLQFFGADNFFEPSIRKTKAVVKSLTAKIYVMQRQELLTNVRRIEYAKEIHGLMTLSNNWLEEKFTGLQNLSQGLLEEKSAVEVSFQEKINSFMKDMNLLNNLKLSNMKRVQTSDSKINRLKSRETQGSEFEALTITEPQDRRKTSKNNVASSSILKRSGSLLEKLFIENQLGSKEKADFKKPKKIDYSKVYKPENKNHDEQNVVLKKSALSNISPILTISAVSSRLKSIEQSKKKGKGNLEYDVGNIANQFESDLKKQIGQYLFKNKLLPTESLRKYVTGEFNRPGSQMDSRENAGRYVSLTREVVLYKTLKLNDDKVKKLRKSANTLVTESLEEIKKKYITMNNISPKNKNYFQSTKKFFKRENFKQSLNISDPNSLVSTGMSFFKNHVPLSSKSAMSNPVSDERKYTS